MAMGVRFASPLVRLGPLAAALLTSSVLAKPSCGQPSPHQPVTSAQIGYKGIWEPVNYPEDVALNDVFFVSADEGWATGGTTVLRGGIILHTVDGGDHWEAQLGDPQSADRAPTMLRFLDQRTGWAVRPTGLAGQLLHTRDGHNWIVAGSMAEHQTDYMFTSETHGIVLASAGISITDDGGRTWKPASQCEARVTLQGLARVTPCKLVRLQMLTPTVGYAVGSSYQARTFLFLLKTSDGGVSWTTATAELGEGASDAFFIDERTGYVLGISGQLYKTEDAGQTWTGMAASPGKHLQFADPEVGWSVAYRKVAFTSDGGNHWTSREYGFPASVEAFSMPRRDRAYVVGNHGMIYRYRTVPDEYSAKDILAAPLLSGIVSPLDGAVQTLAVQAQQVATDAGVAPLSFVPDSGTAPAAGASSASTGAAAANSAPVGAGGFTQDVGLVETQVNAVAAELPKFTTKYRSLNLLLAGVTVASRMPALLADLTQSIQALKRVRDPQAAVGGVQELQTKVTSFWQMMRMAFQKPGAPAAGTFQP